MKMLQRIRGFAARSGDSEETTSEKALILAMALSCCACGLAWAALYYVVFGVGLTMALPLAFVVIVGAGIAVSAIIADHRPLIYVQLTCITWIAALIQWSIGSAADSGLVICWSFLGPIGALIFLPLKQALVWMAMFVGIVAVSAIVDPALLGSPLPVSPQTRSLFLTMNMGVASIVVFGATAWFVRTIQSTLSELKQAQARLIDSEKQAVVGRLVSGILHEMNTPMGAIRSSTDTMNKAVERLGAYVEAHAGEDDPDAKRALIAMKLAAPLRELTKSSVERLSSVVEGLAKFASLDKAEMKPVDVRESLDSAAALLADLRDVRIERHYDETAPEVPCFPSKLNQVFLSVLTNAAHACSPGGEISIRVEAATEELRIEIADNGRGIPDQQLAHLFEIGFTRKGGRIGMQLGLAMSKQHLDEISGTIAVESELGVGTTVRIVLPLP